MLYVKIENGEVVSVWDTEPPAEELGWRAAVEIRHDIIPNRQVHNAHYFDLACDPVQIIYTARTLSLEERKDNAEYAATLSATFDKQALERNRDGTMTADEIATAVEEIRLGLLALGEKVEAATTHEGLDCVLGIIL